ncbi:hypothetical protein KA517_03790 [Candidatus Gracilibacteria bacterium]|nr:hypothetical protein [Candidatus Gracilibacteria bacterium]
MAQDLGRILQEIGLDRRESAFYLASLQLGKALVSDIARTADLNRSASYEVLEQLKQKGLVSVHKVTRGLQVSPTDPDQLLVQQRERYELLNQHLPDLKYLFTVAKREPGVKFYQGKDGLKTVLQLLLAEREEVCVYGDGDAFAQAIPGWTEQYADERARRQIRSRLILKSTPDVLASLRKRKIDKNPKSQLSKLRVLPAAMDVHGGFDIVGNKVILFSFDQYNSAVVIESVVITAMMRGVFEMLWNLAEQYS